MLLGHDILHHLGAMLDLNTETLFLNGERIPMHTKFRDDTSIVAKVTVAKRIVVPPNSAVRLRCKISTQLDDYVIEPTDKVMKLGVLMPRCVRPSKSEPIICLVNTTDSYKTIKRTWR